MQQEAGKGRTLTGPGRPWDSAHGPRERGQPQPSRIRSPRGPAAAARPRPVPAASGAAGPRGARRGRAGNGAAPRWRAGASLPAAQNGGGPAPGKAATP